MNNFTYHPVGPLVRGHVVEPALNLPRDGAGGGPSADVTQVEVKGHVRSGVVEPHGLTQGAVIHLCHHVSTVRQGHS